MEHTHKGRTWTAIGREPYTRKDGSLTELIRWQTKCAKCDEMVEIRTSAKYDTTKAFETMHCLAHKLTQAEVMQRGRNAQKTAKKQRNAGSDYADLC